MLSKDVDSSNEAGRDPVSLYDPDCLRCQHKHYLRHSMVSQQRRVCCGGMVRVQVDLMAAGGWQGPGHPAELRTARLLSKPLATPFSKVRVGQWSLPRLSLQPAGGWLGHPSTSSVVCFTTSPLPHQPHVSPLLAGPRAPSGGRRQPP